MRGGGKRATRRWDPAENDWKFTALGKSFYSTLRRNYLVQVPVKVAGKRKDGSAYTLKTWMPIEKFGLTPINMPLNLTYRQRLARVKASVQGQLDRGALLEYSDETWSLDGGGSWRIHEETVGVDNGEGEAHVILDRRVGTRPVICTLPFPEAIMPEAFEEHDDMLCVPRQLAALLRKDFSEICTELEEAEQALYGTCVWQTEGCSPRMIFEFCRRKELACVAVHMDAVIEVQAGNKPIVAFAIHGSHCYFYQDRKARQLLMKRELPSNSAKVQKQSRPNKKTPPAIEWGVWNWRIEPGHFFVEDESINSVRGWFLQQQRHPRVVLKDELTIRCLVYTCSKIDQVSGVCVVHAMPKESSDIMEWLQRLPVSIEYRGEGLPGITNKVLLALLGQKNRRFLTGEEKNILLEQYQYSCSNCGAQTSELEWDHIVPLSQSMDGEQPMEGFAPLCRACHQNKTCNESRNLDGNVLASKFEKSVYDTYVLSERLPPLVYQAHDVQNLSRCEIADVRRCRKRALEFCAHDIPIFSPLDQIEEVQDCTLGDLNFVTRPATNFIKQLGYSGPGWQHRVLTEWLLHTGTISWRDVSHRLRATAHYPADCLRKPLEVMEDAWDGLEHAKRAVNSMIGLWARDGAVGYRLVSSEDGRDAPLGSMKHVFHYEGGSVTDYLVPVHTVSSLSLRPLHDLCLSSEATRVGQMIYAIRQTGGSILQFKTDSCLYRPKRKSKLAEIAYDQLHCLRGTARCLDCYSTMTPNQSVERVFRVSAATESDLMKSDPGLPARRCERPIVRQLVWRDLTPEEAEQRIADGQGCLVLGCAGTGKSTFMSSVVERLRSTCKVDIISKTHCAAARIKGDTCDHYVRRRVLFGHCSADYIWCDEIFQSDISILGCLNQLTYTNVRFLFTGDPHQFGAIGNCWRGATVPEDAFMHSRLLHRMVDGNRLVLTQCRRSEESLFNFFSSLIPGGVRFDAPLSQCLQDARQQFNFDGPARYNLTISHKKRKQINGILNRHFKPPGAVFVRVNTCKAVGLNEPQSMFLWPGLELYGCVQSERKGIKNQVLYNIEEIGNEGVVLQGGIQLSFEEARNWLRLSFAQTYSSSQGTEFSETLRLHDTNSKFFTKRHLFVGLSRAKRADMVSVV